MPSEYSEGRASGALPFDDPLYAPGLKRRARAGGETLYWIPPAKDIKTGWALKAVCVTGSELEVAQKCRALWTELETWRGGRAKAAPVQYTLGWLIRRYQSDPLSPYKTVREKTRKGYDTSCKIIDATRGDERIDATLVAGMLEQRLAGADIRQWHHEWGLPDASGHVTAPTRARHCIEMLRILLGYAIELKVPGAKDLREGLLSVLRFPATQAREAAPTREQVLAIVNAALAYRPKYPKRDPELMNGWRSVAIATLAQFEFTERRISILGTHEAGQWRPGWVWQNISPDWRISYHQNKVGRVLREFSLHDTPALLELLQAIPEEKRVGPVVICEKTGKPWHERWYAKVFRRIAKQAGIPDGIWSMDMRAGGATEADAIQGVTMKDLQGAGGWTDPASVARYSRGHIRAAQRVVQLRQKQVKDAG